MPINTCRSLAQYLTARLAEKMASLVEGKSTGQVSALIMSKTNAIFRIV